MVTQHTILDMTPGTKPIVNVSQYDTGARTLVFHLRQNRQTFTPPDGCTAIIHGIKPDSTYFSYAAEIDGDTVVADCTEQMTACVGFAECEIRLSNTEGHVGSANFLLNCEKSPMTGAVISESVIAAAEQLATRAEQAAATAISAEQGATESAEAAAESAANAGESADRAAREAETASQAAEEAGESATAAAESASSASGSEASARGFAEQAEGFAGEAAESAQGAAQDAQTASAKASEAAASADRASGSAVDSANAANLASGYADTAQAQAQAAGESATNAAGSASTASQAAATATTKSGEASSSATAASTSAGQAASSASAASASAGTASEKATQAGESATNAANSASAAAGSASDASDSADSAAASARAAAQSAADIAASAAQIQINTDNISALQIVESTEAADITSIDDGADGVPMQSLKVYIEPVQDLHGYDNPWPGGGGTNQWDEEWESGVYSVSDGLPRARADAIRCKNPIPVLANTEYYFLCEAHPSAGDGVWLWYDTDGNYITYATGKLNRAQTSPANAGYLKFYIAPETTYNHDIAINYPATVTTYSPYSNICPISGWNSVETVRTDANGGNRLTITTDLPSTVYGGVLDVISGLLTVDRVLKVFDGSETFLTRGDYAKLYNSGIQMLNSTSTPTAISSHFKRLERGGWAELIANYFLIAGNTYIGLGWAGSVDDLKTFLTEQYTAGTPVQVAGFLATPTTYTLSPEEVKTLLKTNNIFADAGQTAIVYVADPKTYIDSAIADAVASLT